MTNIFIHAKKSEKGLNWYAFTKGKKALTLSEVIAIENEKIIDEVELLLKEYCNMTMRCRVLKHLRRK